jgi:DNA-binding GntR family transcriptional regulator
MPKSKNVWNQEEITPIRDKVYQYIKTAILNGEYQSGDRIIERELAEKLQISRTPIREALFRLESQGFVKTLPRKGVVVSKLSPEEVVEIFTILSSLESLAVKLAAQKMDMEQRNILEKLISNINSALIDPDFEKKDWSSFHIEINDVIYHASKSPRLYKILNGLIDYIRAFVNVGHEIPGRTRRAMEEHRDIAQAVYNGEGDLAENFTKIHIDNSKKAYLEALDRQ